MRESFLKILTVLMSFVVLCSTMSFTIDMHYCGDTLVDSALFKKAKSCGMEMQQTSDSGLSVVTKKKCCTDKQLILEGQDELKTSLDTFTYEQQVFVASLHYTHLDVFLKSEAYKISFPEYPPPLLVKDIHVLNETFLI